MNEDTLTLAVFTAINVLIYVTAFVVAYYKKQSVTVYCVLIGVQLFMLFLGYVLYTPSGSDAAGSGMAQGYFYLIFMCFHAVVMLVVAGILLVRVSSVKFWIYFAIAVAAITLCAVAYQNISFKNIIRIPHKPESKVELRIESEISTGTIVGKAKVYAVKKLLKTINDNYLPAGMPELAKEEFISRIKLYSSNINKDGTYSLYYDGLFQHHYIIVDVSSTDIPVNARIGTLYD